jgi:hypothetical protein
VRSDSFRVEKHRGCDQWGPHWEYSEGARVSSVRPIEYDETKGAHVMRQIIGTAMLAATTVLLCSAGTAEASTSTGLHAKVPFSFVVNGRTFPAGRYTIQREDIDRSVLLIRCDTDAHAAMFVSTIPDSGHDPAGSKPALSFRRYENQYRLTGVWQDNHDGWDLIGR